MSSFIAKGKFFRKVPVAEIRGEKILDCILFLLTKQLFRLIWQSLFFVISVLVFSKENEFYDTKIKLSTHFQFLTQQRAGTIVFYFVNSLMGRSTLWWEKINLKPFDSVFKLALIDSLSSNKNRLLVHQIDFCISV